MSNIKKCENIFLNIKLAYTYLGPPSFSKLKKNIFFFLKLFRKSFCDQT